jgi:hypothetical protein
MTLDGERPLAPPTREATRLLLAVPPYEGRVAAVLIETAKPSGL